MFTPACSSSPHVRGGDEQDHLCLSCKNKASTRTSNCGEYSTKVDTYFTGKTKYLYVNMNQGQTCKVKKCSSSPHFTVLAVIVVKGEACVADPLTVDGPVMV